MFTRAAIGACVLALGLSAAAPAKTSHAGWPNDLKLKKQFSNEPLKYTGTDANDEILGHHGSDTISGGGGTNVLWGDFDPDGQPGSQFDRITGGPNKDFIYSSHGYNVIDAGAGDDYVKMHFGRGKVDCGPGKDILEISRKAQKKTKIKNCEEVTHRTLGY